MDYLKVALLILAYTIGTATIVVQIICYLKQIEYIETILLSVSFLTVILITTLQESGLLLNPDSVYQNSIFSSVMFIIFSTTIPVNVHRERIVRYAKLRNLLLMAITLIFLIIIVALHLDRALKEVNIIIAIYLNFSILYSMSTVLLSKPSVLISRREKQERFTAVIIGISMLLAVPLKLIVFRKELWHDFIFYSPYFLSAICIFLCLFKLPDDIRRLFLFSVRSEIDVSQLEKYHITAREAEVLKLLVQGISYREIGNRLFISMPTVKTHVTSIYKKLNVKNKVELSNLLK